MNTLQLNRASPTAIAELLLSKKEEARPTGRDGRRAGERFNGARHGVIRMNEADFCDMGLQRRLGTVEVPIRHTDERPLCSSDSLNPSFLRRPLTGHSSRPQRKPVLCPSGRRCCAGDGPRVAGVTVRKVPYSWPLAPALHRTRESFVGC
jgi:hypothetical protein